MNKPGAAPSGPIILLPKPLDLEPKWVSRGQPGPADLWGHAHRTMTRWWGDGSHGLALGDENREPVTETEPVTGRLWRLCRLW